MYIKKKSEVIKRFLVLSDFHIKEDSDHVQYDSFETNLLAFLNEDIGKLDYVLLCGDLTDQNSPHGYKKLLKTLKKVHSSGIISKYSDIICCPGNHDLDRSVIENTHKLVQAAKPNNRKGKPKDWLVTYLSEKEDSYQRIEAIHSEKFTEYIAFLEKLYPTQETKTKRAKPGFTINVDNSILITSINAAWYCMYPDNRASDDGNLVLGMNYVKKVMNTTFEGEQRSNAIPRLTIMHFPPESFVWKENYGSDINLNTMKYITDNSSLVVSGHVHGLPRTMGFNKGAHMISNGTSYNDKLTMSFTQFDLNIHTGDVELFEYQISKDDGSIKPQPQHFQSFRVPLIKCKDFPKVVIQ